MNDFPHLFAPLQVGRTTLRNRMVMGAMHTRLETLDRPVERLAAFYSARAKGEIGLILTGGYSPTPEGVIEAGAPLLNSVGQLHEHRAVVDAVHGYGGRIVLQILHAGRYAKVPNCVAPSAGKARINAFSPRVLSTAEVWETVAAYAWTAQLAKAAGYDGVEIMGSEGYLINEFAAARTNQRTDEFGGDFDARVRFPLEIVRAVRERVGADMMLVYRISAVDLVEGGMSGRETAGFARRIEVAGADVINTGIGWHEASVPTIAASVPRAAWAFAVGNVKRAVSIPVIASNRINTPDVAEDLIASGIADLVSMARPLLADPDFAMKTRLGIVDEISPCIACNQACLDHIFTERTATCLVNPRAGHEIEFAPTRADPAKRIAVVGAGPAGMAFAINASQRGHRITLFEAAQEPGGQLNMAKVAPGKSEFDGLLRYFRTMLKKTGVDVRLGHAASAQELASGGFAEIVLATGVVPRKPAFDGVDHPKVLSYVDVLLHRVAVGERVAIIGAGGIGFDVADFLVADHADDSRDVAAFQKTWGVDGTHSTQGGIVDAVRDPARRRTVYMLQRKPAPLGRRLGKSTGWILKTRLRNAGVQMIGGAAYERVDDRGFHYWIGDEPFTLEVDNVVLCAGQLSNRSLHQQLRDRGINATLIGGADVASELDAIRAIDQATRLAVAI
ncbi:MAG: NADPH-dependent 2,4-dienoyl-CoA reductase [Paraburkholderia sp.]|uniref:oxidoreductase n=1 Tax=Paraburkholderia sp. TaxID=1926495 RepID=UPI003979C9F0